MFFFKYIILIFFFIINGCDSFKRFDQEKYSCIENKLSINTIDILKTSSIQKAYVTVGKDEFYADIISNNKKEIVLSINGIYIKINKSLNEISVNFDNKLYFLSCDMENFKI